jgi:2-keto-4-pentenoate hydratase/2-oxohepta-3-ene-1,7-dioic acid hydratase in catechol pathway
MKLVSYRRDGAVRVGLVDADDVVDLIDALGGPSALAPDAAATAASMLALIEAGDRGLDLARRALERARGGAGSRIRYATADLDVPVRPGLILASGGNYSDHREEKLEAPLGGREPEFFFKTPNSVVAHGDPLERDPRVTQKLDYEVELAVVIGKKGRHITEDRVDEHIFGYTVLNDVTARERQVRYKPDGTMFYEAGSSKNFDNSTPLGPCIVTRDEVRDPQNLALRTYVNGDLRQNNNTCNMTYSVRRLVSFFSTFLTLHPGYVIATGTPGGTAWGNDPELGGVPYPRSDVVRGGYLQVGDVVTCEVEGIGALTNPVGGPQHA